MRLSSDLCKTDSKYRFMESNANQRKTNMSGKLVEFEETLQVLASLVSRGDLTVDSSFELSDTLYAKATIPPVERVHLWLGANVMLSYEIMEAQQLLQDKQRTASQGYANALDDLDWLREQITVTEVNIARVYNWDVKARRSSQG